MNGWRRVLTAAACLLLTLMLIGCSADSLTPTAAPEATAVEAGETQRVPTEEQTPAVEPEPEQPEVTEPAAEPTLEPSPTPVVVVDVDSACVNCHTDTDRLKELATEPEAVHLSSGEG